jgi:DNA-binding SARP family transcriptional activator
MVIARATRGPAPSTRGPAGPTGGLAAITLDQRRHQVAPTLATERRPPRALPTLVDDPPAPVAELTLTRGFELRVQGHVIELPRNSERLVAFLALSARSMFRGYVAGILWLDHSEERALANLRSALWRLRGAGVDVVSVVGDRLELGRDVVVDVRELTAWARAVDRAPEVEPDVLERLLAARELLADWYDDWTVAERERFRHLRLHALEACCRRLSEAGDHARAIEAGLAAVAEESLRESAQRVLIAAHLAEGNVGEALQQYWSFHGLLARELGLSPSRQLEELVAPYRRHRRASAAR